MNTFHHLQVYTGLEIEPQTCSSASVPFIVFIRAGRCLPRNPIDAWIQVRAPRTFHLFPSLMLFLPDLSELCGSGIFTDWDPTFWSKVKCGDLPGSIPGSLFFFSYRGGAAHRSGWKAIGLFGMQGVFFFADAETSKPLPFLTFGQEDSLPVSGQLLTQESIYTKVGTLKHWTTCTTECIQDSPLSIVLFIPKLKLCCPHAQQEFSIVYFWG